MAQHTVVVLVDDLDDSEASETVSFALDGVEYEIDLNDEHAEALRDAMEPYVEAARRVGGRRTAKRPSRTQPTSGPSASEIREWARENGWEVPERGRVSAEVREAYTAAH